MWSVGKTKAYYAKGTIVHLFEPFWSNMSLGSLLMNCWNISFYYHRIPNGSFCFCDKDDAGGSGVRLNDGPDIKLFILVGFGPELFCLLLDPLGFNCWFSFVPVFQWCCSAPRGFPGVGRNTFLSNPHLCFIITCICDLFVSRVDPLMS